MKMFEYLKDIRQWITSFPRPWNKVTIKGGVLSKGGTVFVGKGVYTIIDGPVCAEGHVYLEVKK